MMAFFCFTIWSSFLMGAVFHEVTSANSNYAMEDFKSNLTCRSFHRTSKMNCTWSTLEAYQNCSLFFRITTTLKEIDCSTSYSNWTKCLRPSAVNMNECIFPGSSGWHCSDSLEAKLRCNLNSTVPVESEVVHINHDETIVPNPPHTVILQNKGKKTMNVTWRSPKRWPENDKHWLAFNVQYWQEWLPNGTVKFASIPVNESSKNEEPFTVIHVKYADVTTCVHIGVTYVGSSISKWSWSDIVCKRTIMERPTVAVQDDLLLIALDSPEQALRKVNITWKEIPVELQGAPIQFYMINVTNQQTGNTTNITVSGNQTYCILDLNRYTSYNIHVAAVNQIGISDVIAFANLPADVPEVKHKWHMHAAFVAMVILILLVVVSTVIACRKKMIRAARNIRAVKIRQPSEVVLNRHLKTENEVFDVPGKRLETKINPSTKSTKEDETSPSIEVDPLLVTRNSMVGVTINSGGYIQTNIPNGTQLGTNYVEESIAGI